MRPVLGASLSVIPRVDGMEYGGERRRWDGEEETIREGVKPKGMQCPSLYRLSVRGYKTFCPYANTLHQTKRSRQATHIVPQSAQLR